MQFPREFYWGAATASYQIEGAIAEDGRGPSIWDMYCRTPGAIYGSHTGDIADDHYHHFREDVALMREIGLGAYRFSLSWSRILPAGTGAVNARGLAFYDALVDALLEAGVEPFITLYHWDLPYDLYCRGGWLNRECADWFAEYTAVVVEKLSDRVTNWMTLNEPQCFIGLGMLDGTQAPGLKLAFPEMLRAGHHALLAHGKAVQTIRTQSKRPCHIGFAPVGVVKVPASERPEDIDAACRAMFSITDHGYWNNTWWMDPVYNGTYPADGLELFRDALPPIADDDLAQIHQPLDFCGANIYHGVYVRAGVDGNPEELPFPVGFPLNSMSWPVVPEALRWGPRFLYERYGLPIAITENGCANADWIALDGQVHDSQRIDYTQRYLIELAKAGEDGAKLLGYFHWSLMDNFEWAEGYKERLGLIFVDYPTQRRILKDSARWYRDVIATQGACLTATIANDS